MGCGFHSECHSKAFGKTFAMLQTALSCSLYEWNGDSNGALLLLRAAGRTWEFRHVASAAADPRQVSVGSRNNGNINNNSNNYVLLLSGSRAWARTCVPGSPHNGLPPTALLPLWQGTHLAGWMISRRQGACSDDNCLPSWGKAARWPMIRQWSLSKEWPLVTQRYSLLSVNLFVVNVIGFYSHKILAKNIIQGTQHLPLLTKCEEKKRNKEERKS